MIMKRLAIIGSGDLGQLIAYYAQSDGHYIVAGFFDDYKEKGGNAGGFPILGKIADIENDYSSGVFDCVIIAIGYKHLAFKMQLYNNLKGKVPLGTIVHSSCFVAPSCTIGNGVVVLPRCTFDNNVVLEDNIFLNIGVNVAHDSMIKTNSFISPAVSIAGFAVVGESCNIGIHTTIIDNVVICNNVQTGGGAVVVKNIEIPGLYVGVPAKKIK